MPVVISDELVVSQVQDFDANNPILGWRTFVTPSLIFPQLVNNADDDPTDPDFPAANMASKTTESRWQIAEANISDDIAIVYMFDGLQQIDYFAFAGHNLGTNQRAVRIFGTTDTIDGSETYTALAQEVILANDGAVLFRFAPANYTALKFVMLTSYLDTEELYISVAFAGKLLVIERKIQVSFTPLTMGRRPEIFTGRSENGKYLGRIVKSEWLESAASIAFLSSDWYRQHMDEFVEASQTDTFFFAWAPVSYPLEIGYAWIMNDNMPQITHAVGDGDHLISIVLDMQGIR